MRWREVTVTGAVGPCRFDPGMCGPAVRHIELHRAAPDGILNAPQIAVGQVGKEHSNEACALV